MPQLNGEEKLKEAIQDATKRLDKLEDWAQDIIKHQVRKTESEDKDTEKKYEVL